MRVYVWKKERERECREQQARRDATRAKRNQRGLHAIIDDSMWRLLHFLEKNLETTISLLTLKYYVYFWIQIFVRMFDAKKK